MDKSLKCVDCGADFLFTTGEQEFYASQGFTSEPRRCPNCRAARKKDRGNGEKQENNARPQNVENSRPPRQMFTAVCAECGKDTQVPFQPTNGRPVYCSDCYRNNGGNNRSNSRSSAPRAAAAPAPRKSSFSASSFSASDFESFAEMYPPPASNGRNRKRDRRDRDRGRDRDMDNEW